MRMVLVLGAFSSTVLLFFSVLYVLTMGDGSVGICTRSVPPTAHNITKLTTVRTLQSWEIILDDNALTHRPPNIRATTLLHRAETHGPILLVQATHLKRPPPSFQQSYSTTTTAFPDTEAEKAAVEALTSDTLHYE